MTPTAPTRDPEDIRELRTELEHIMADGTLVWQRQEEARAVRELARSIVEQGRAKYGLGKPDHPKGRRAQAHGVGTHAGGAHAHGVPAHAQWMHARRRHGATRTTRCSKT